MESRLKALKVADLKVYLQKAGLDTNGKKQDLVNRILENKSARDIFEPPTDATWVSRLHSQARMRCSSSLSL